MTRAAMEAPLQEPSKAATGKEVGKMRVNCENIAGVFMTGALALSVVSCDDTPAGPGSAEPSFGVATSTMEASLSRFTWALAVTLGQDDELRTMVRAAMADSPFREGKLEFAAVIDDAGFGLTDALARTEGRTASSIRATRDSIVPLEMYLPVPAHRAWAGGKDLIVASALGDRIIAAFDLSGVPVHLTDASPPDRPTLALVPVETDFGRRRSLATGLAGSSGSGGSGHGVVRMVLSHLSDLQEHWLKGNPEIVIHLADNDTGGFFSCSGNKVVDGSREFDQNSISWTGTVDVGYEADLDRSVNIEIWEDDYEECYWSTFSEQLYNRNPAPDNSTKSALALVAGTGLVSLFGCALGAPCLKLVVGAAAFATFAFVAGSLYENDDLVGIVKNPPTGCVLFGIDPARVHLHDKNGNYLSDHWIDLVADNLNSECPLEVQITGDTYACTVGDPTGEFSSIVQNGSGTITYEWTEDGVVRGTSSDYSLYDLTEGTREVVLEVTRGEETDSDVRYVDVIDDPEGEVCEL